MNGLEKLMPDERRSIRLRGYDYRQSNAYFVTICTFQRKLLFAEARWRIIAEQRWMNIAKIAYITLDAWIMMPDHMHGIIVIEHTQLNPPVSADGSLPYPLAGSLGAVVRSFKASVTQRINAIRKTPLHPVWQRGYWERIVRNDAELNSIRQYIHANPARWREKKDNLDELLRRMKGGVS